MTERNATAAVVPAFPPGRYGRRREPVPHRPWVGALLATLVVAASLAIGYKLYHQYGQPDFAPRILAETERTDERVTIRLEVRRASGAAAAACLVRARARDGLVVGSAEVAVPAGRRTVQTYTLPTTERAFVVDVLRCRAAPAPVPAR